MDKNICEAASQADTFIERCFERRCEKLNNGEEILNQWRNDKAEYISATNTTSIDFQHYSMHDKSHSIAILQYVEMILGRDRVELLCTSDLWLLLESAYCHDIGMALTYEELCGLWKKEAFKEYVKNSLYAEMVDQRKVAVFYERLDRLVHNKKLFMESAQAEDIEGLEEFEEDFDEIFNRNCWAVVTERYITLLYTEYIRRMHPERSMEKIIEYGVNAEKKIAQRMYRIVAKVVFLHGEDFERIFTEVFQCDNGFGAETLHPQFAAAMLRLGDLLDMDSNRFNLRMLKHMGIGLLPTNSMLHLKKHKSITHLAYSSSEIQAEARSNEYEVCKTTNRWFMLLDQEVQDLICNWNKIVPEELIGCRLKKCDLRIYCNNERFDASRQMKFTVDPVRVYDMLIGNNIYHSRMDFIREYLQNAMDASKMKLWLNLKEKWGKDIEVETITPYDIELNWYEQCQIDVGAEVDWEKGLINFSFQDHGIGMEEKCVAALSAVVSDSWRRRSDYASEIRNMPSWLRPTGGFGIGVQSAFMIADSVVFLTCSEKEGVGRRICLESSKKSGTVSVSNDPQAVKGTKVLIEVRISEFLKEVVKHEDEGTFELDTLMDNPFDPNELPRVILHILEKYIQQTAKYSIVPIRIRCGREKDKYVGMEWADILSEREISADNRNAICPRRIFQLSLKRQFAIADSEYDIRYEVRNNKIYLWDCTRGNMVVCSIASSAGEKIESYYKGILIKQETVHTSDRYSMDVICFDDVVSRNLTVNRDKFKAEKRIEYKEDIERYRCALIMVFADNIQKFKDEYIVKGIAQRALALNLAETVKLGKKQIKNLSEAAGEISVRTLDYDKLEQSVEKLQQYFGQSDSKDLAEDSRLQILLLQMYQIKRISFEELAASVKKNACIIYRLKECKDQADIMRFSQYLSKIREYRQLRGERTEPNDFWISWHGLFYKLSQPNCFIITETDMCDALSINMQNKTQKELKLVINGRFADGLAVIDKLYHRESKNKGTLQKFVCDQLEQKVEQNETFPIVLQGTCLMNKELPWVSKSFPGVDFISIDGTEKNKSGFLILPFTRSMWNELIREKENGFLTRQKYDSIVKDEVKAKMYIDWTYCWQAASGFDRLKRSQIWERYIKLLDQIYNWVFK